jgi:glutamyl-tRNA synthetase
LQPRIETLGQIAEQIDFLQAVPDYDVSLYENKKMKTTPEVAQKALTLVLPVLENVAEWNNENLFEVLKKVAVDHEMKNGQILYPVRIALSGKETTPGGATELAVILGKEETLKRIRAALQKLA